eukprot:TRINITY_DN5343_c0_g1_i1.p1 TRINITY_DN5343_c0_g1~~TRINITY_DN5343_c0_g1_i1.p1  ORF type:complete len:1207 (+),score=155.86 TRINITY_DN5343_c0_g1_i1:58-3678(+)
MSRVGNTVSPSKRLPFRVGYGNELMTIENIQYLLDKNVHELLARMLHHLIQTEDTLPLEALIHFLEEDIAARENNSAEIDVLPSPHVIFPTAEDDEEPAPPILYNQPKQSTEPENSPRGVSPTDQRASTAQSVNPSTHPVTREAQSLHYRFQAALGVSADTPQKLAHRALLIDNISQEFVRLVLPIAKVIIEERYWELDDKSIRPLDTSGTTYMQYGIVFRFANTDGVTKLLGSRENGLKVLSHERRAMCAALEANVHNLHLPLGIQVNYMGQGLWVGVQIPFSPLKLVYGSIDSGQTVAKNSVEFAGLAKQLAESLQLKGHLTGRTESGRKLLHTNVDAQGYYCVTEGRYYLMGLSRLFPPFIPDLSLRNAYLFQLLRPEAVLRSPSPLSSDSYSPFGRSQSDDEDTRKVALQIIQHQLPLLAKKILQQDQANGTNGQQLVDAAHALGINCRYLSLLAPLFPPGSRPFIVLKTELVARTFRVILGDMLDEKLREPDTLEVQLLAVVNEAFHLLLETSPDSASFWSQTLLPRMCSKFGSQVLPCSLDTLDKVELFFRCCNLAGVRFAMTDHLTFSDFASSPGSDLCRTSGEPVAVDMVVKPISILDFDPMRAAFREGDLAKVISIGIQRITDLESTVGATSTALVPVLGLLSLAQAISGAQPGTVEAHLQRIISIREAEKDPTDACLVDSMRAVADFCMQQGKLADATTVLGRCQAYTEQQFGREHPVMASVLITIGHLQLAEGRQQEALTAYSMAFTIRDRAFGRDHPQVAESLVFIGLYYAHIGKGLEAMPFFQQAVDTYGRVFRNTEHPDAGVACFYLAVAAYNTGRQREAMSWFQWSYPILEAAFGENDPTTAACASYIANLGGAIPASRGTNISTGNVPTLTTNRSDPTPVVHVPAAQSQPAVVGSAPTTPANPPHAPLAIERVSNSPTPPPSIIPTVVIPIPANNVTTVNSSTRSGAASPARSDSRAAPGILTMTTLTTVSVPTARGQLTVPESATVTMSSTHPRSPAANEVAQLRVLLEQKRYAEALPLYRAYVELEERRMEPQSDEVAGLLTQLAHVAQYANDPLASEYYRRVLHIRERVNGETHPLVADALRFLGHAYDAEGKYDDALMCYDRAMIIWEAHFARSPAFIASALQIIAELHTKFGKTQQALETWQRVLAMRVLALGAKHPDTLSAQAEVEKLKGNRNASVISRGSAKK